LEEKRDGAGLGDAAVRALVVEGGGAWVDEADGVDMREKGGVIGRVGQGVGMMTSCCC
jgi:hypothetical protein